MGDGPVHVDGADPAPVEWQKVRTILSVQVRGDAHGPITRTFRYKKRDDGEDGSGPETIYPAYTPPVEHPSGDDGSNSGWSPNASAAGVASKYWADASKQARNTAKWIATSLGAALALVIGTAPLTPLTGRGVNWAGGAAVLLGLGLVLLGTTFFMAIAVLVPGLTTYGNLMGPPPQESGSIKWVRQHLDEKQARYALAAKAADQSGIMLPIGISSLDELGHRIRIEELTLAEVEKEIALAEMEKKKKKEMDADGQRERALGQLRLDFVARLIEPMALAGEAIAEWSPSASAEIDPTQFWGRVKTSRGWWLQKLSDEAWQ